MTEKLAAHLRSVWQRDQVLHRTAGGLTFCRWALGLFLVGMGLDWLLGLPAGGRIAILLLLLSVAAWRGWRAGWGQLRRFDAARTALRVESARGGMESLFVTAVQFEAAHPGVSAAMGAKTRADADAVATTLRPDETVSFQGLRRGLWLALVPIVVLGGLAVNNLPLLQVGFGRIFAPWLEIEYPTRTQIALRDGDQVVKEGDGVRLVAQLSGELPAVAHIVLRTGRGKPRRRELAVADRACAYVAETVFRSFDYRIEAGDARSPWRSVRVISAPRIERAEVQLEFPDYTRRPPQTLEALTLTVPEGTRVRWRLSLDRAVRSAEFRPVEGTAMPLDVSSDGRTVTLAQLAKESRAYSFGWVGGERGFAFSSPRYYLQVAPDRAPTVELTSPRGMLFATLSRELEFAYRGRDDHGIGAAALTYRVNKTAETKVVLPVPKADGGEQRIAWDYREALPDLAIGDTVAFAVELTDRYPGAEGPHRVRSDVRRVRFLSQADYLAQIEKQKRRLLARVRAIYREERGVHDLVRDLDPAADVYLQTCQLEAVRQDLIRERLAAIRERIEVLVADVAANKLAAEAQSQELVGLGQELARIGKDHVGRAAALLRELATVDGGTRDPSAAVDKVHDSARELGLVVLQLGFAEAADVMARELHATAQAQAGLRHRTLTADRDAGLASRQTRLAEETARLLGAIPKNQESTPTNALIAFNLSRLVNGLLRSGVDTKMRRAAERVTAAPEAAARTQAAVIAALLRAEFRLRQGAEFEALTTARDELEALAEAYQKLGAKGSAETRRELQRRVRMLLLPEIPAPRPKLFDAVPPKAPPVAELLMRGEKAEQSWTAAAQAFAELARIVRLRLDTVTQEQRMQVTVTAFAKQAAQRLVLEERLLVLLEQTEDAVAAKATTAALATLSQALAQDARSFRATVALWTRSIEGGVERAKPLLGRLDQFALALDAATTELRTGKGGQAVGHFERALEAVEAAGAWVDGQARTLAAFANVLATTRAALAPSPLLVEIEAEQEMLSATAKTAKAEQRKALVLPQKNLIHAVNAVLSALDPLAHKIESGTVMLFAKEDMTAAATGLETNDIEEAQDAQAFVVETLQKLRAKIDKVTPEYRYVREVCEFMAEVLPRGAGLETGLDKLRMKAEDAPDAGDWKRQVEQYGQDLQRLTGADRYVVTAQALLAAATGGDDTDALATDLDGLQTLIENLAYLITPPQSGAIVEKPTPEVQLIHKALAVAGHHQDLLRATPAATAKQLVELAEKQRALATQTAAFVPDRGGPPPLIAARDQLAQAATALAAQDRNAAIASQQAAADSLRYFLLDYAMKHVQVPPPAGPQDPAPSDDAIPDDGELQLFMPGALTGKRPKGGRLEWQVLGRRTRAALNENFARELPLEYRAILKDYYERLTR